MTIGQSQRTVMKHSLLNKMLGREVGALGTGKLGGRRYLMLDLCAGDAEVTAAAVDPSPRCFLKHASYLAKRIPGMPWLTFIEKNPIAFRKLSRFVEAADVKVTIDHWNMNAQDFDASKLFGDERDLCFILNDPNSVEDWAISQPMLAAAPTRTTTLTTLGCNPSGLKRLSLDHRMKWFEHVMELLACLPPHADAMLVRLNRDSAQWAYLLSGPKKWFDEARYQDDAVKAFKTWKPGIEMARWKPANQAFKKICEELFLTRKELAT